jgi:hypothetical protein
LNTKKVHSNLNSLNTFTKETGSNKVKLPKVGSFAIVPVPDPTNVMESYYQLEYVITTA